MTIVGLANDSQHRFSKLPCRALNFIAGIGVEGDAHAGETVQHLSRLARSPQVPNLRQVHLIHSELFDELGARGFAVLPGMMGENVTTRGIALLKLGRGTRLRLGGEVLLEVTGLRNPCRQIDENIGPGAMAAVLERREDGQLTRKAGIMAVVVEGGRAEVGQAICIEWQPAEFVPLEAV